MRKKIDSRIRTLVENCVKLRERGLFIIIGDKGRDQVVNLHYMLSKAVVKARPSVLWCYKKDLHLSSHRKKRMQQIRKQMQRGLLDPEKEDPFSLFVASTNIRYCYYAETQNILGNTYGMCVLQDFEALTPNLLARTIETVEGGGLVIMLVSNLKSLTQLYSVTMDVHNKLRTESHQEVTGRFNERMVLSMASCRHCLMMDDELNVLPTSSLIKYIEPVPLNPDGTPVNDPSRVPQTELKELTESLADTEPAGSLVAKCRTLDQGRAVVTFLDAASEKTLRSTVALTASRGRGKSAALGLAIAGSVGLGYSNIFVTAPSPENLNTLFQFVFKGLDALGFKEHIDYDLVESTNPAFGKAVVRVNIYRNHRQTIQYIQPQHHAKLSQAELLVIDEAAAIPLPLVKAMLGPYLVFLCSTVNGYEGTGRSLSLKLIQQLREQGAKVGPASGDGKGAEGAVASSSGRTFREVVLNEPIRYAPGDPVESWLHEVLCLDAGQHVPSPPPKLPHPDECELFYVNRDTLFSYHKASERFLQHMVSLYVSSHYKNTPNDLILMSDAPAHHLFVLLGPVDETQNVLPDILCVVQVALEGKIGKKAALSSLSRGELPQGDLVPWTVSQQFQDSDFPSLSGARIVRIAVHPEMPRAGYGTRAVELLKRYYQGELTGLIDDEEESGEDGEDEMPSGSKGGKRPREVEEEDEEDGGEDEEKASSLLLTEKVSPRKGLPPLLINLAERKPERLHYIGVSYGLTQQLFNFWQRCGFQPLYLRQSASDTTGEHTVIMAKALEHPEVEGTAWLGPFVKDFKSRFLSLLSGAFRDMTPALALTILDPKLTHSEEETQKSIKGGVVLSRLDGQPLDPHDLKRLQAYSNGLVDYHMILDLLPTLAASYFNGKLPATLSYAQGAILLCLGLQRMEVSQVETTLSLPSNQVLALFSKTVRKLYQHIRAAKEAAVERSLPSASLREAPAMMPHEVDVDEDLDEAEKQVRAELKTKYLNVDDLQQYAINGAEDDFKGVVGSKLPSSGGIVQVPSSGKGSKAELMYKKDTSGKQSKGKKHDKEREGKKLKKSFHKK
ncbi:hypothetical protein CEUSTIGMA_g171.t1 [Chlamydomonas eustigma]|uniref:RNA cytidine acetyltransferase n=1 Tax=Chlamydomonas eustigma TaxID=1157962 RepID=A0A250WPE7_9CHLO|nr:hypothetical protein CEUSTIGMA_g171.t1 [Chlamydomonas eustigma]|eukprot:GAX72715.1 hypothetical protein CEUSTIGMA_g171.t1 [Chlamydomonas eustigma]